MRGSSHGKLGRTPASGWLHRLVRCFALPTRVIFDNRRTKLSAAARETRKAEAWRNERHASARKASNQNSEKSASTKSTSAEQREREPERPNESRGDEGHVPPETAGAEKRSSNRESMRRTLEREKTSLTDECTSSPNDQDQV